MLDAATEDPRQSVDGAAYLSAIEAFGEVAVALHDVTDIDELLHLIAARVCDLVGVSRCSIHLRDDEVAGMFRGAIGHAGTDIDEDVKRSRAGMPADGITQEILASRSAVIVRDARSDPRPVRSTVRYWGIRSLMAVPMKLGDEVIGIIFLDDEARAHDFTPTAEAIASAFGELAAVAVSHTQAAMDLRTRLRVLSRENKGLKRSTILDERLTDLVVGGADLATIITSLAEVMVKPCALHDTDGRCLAAVPLPGADDGILPRLLEGKVASAPAVREALKRCEERRVVLAGPFVELGVLHRYMLASVPGPDGRQATLVVMEHLSRFNPTDLMVARRATSLLGLHLRMERAAVEGDSNAAGSLAVELLKATPDLAMLRRRAEHLDIHLDEPRRVCLFSDCSRRISGIGPQDVVDALTAEDASLRPIATVLGDEIAVLLPAPEESTLADREGVEALLTSACGRLGERTVQVGVSAPYADPLQYAEACEDARMVLTCVQSFWTKRSRPVGISEMIGPGRLFLSSIEPNAALAFVAQTLGPVLDDPSSHTLLATLHLYFTRTSNVKRCADFLGVHENTIRYRLTRVTQLTELAVTSDPDAQLSARLALLILALRGDLDLSELENETGAEGDQRGELAAARVPAAIGDCTTA